MLDRWIKCTGGDHRYIRTDVNLHIDVTDEDTDNWFGIYDEYIERYGLGKHYMKVLLTMKKLALLNVKYGLSILKKQPDRFLETLIEIEEATLKGLMEDNGKGMTIEESLPTLSKAQGYAIRPNQTTFIEYQNYLEAYARSSKTK